MTSYALLGLLNVRSWTTYELAKQVQRSLNWFWPRAERRLYDEPKALAALGLVTADEVYTGRRRGREYTITDAGRDELAAWLDEPPGPRQLEFEGLVKVFFADAGTLDQLRTTVERIQAEAEERLARLASMASAPPTFPERLHLGALSLPFQLEQERVAVTWARWALTQIAQWNDTRDPGDWDAAAVMAALVRRAEVKDEPRPRRPGPAG